MKNRYKILLSVVIVVGCWFILIAPIYPQQERPCDVGFEDTIAGYCVPRIGLPFFAIASVYASEPAPPSVDILLNNGTKSEFYPNDTIQLTITIPPAYRSQNVVVSFTEPSDNKFDDISFRTDDKGKGYVEFKIPNFADVGDYLITARLSDWNYERIEDFEKFSIVSRDIEANHVDFRDASGEIIEVGCGSGLRASPDHSVGDGFLQFLKCNLSATLVLALTLSVIMPSLIFVVWRKRK